MQVLKRWHAWGAIGVLAIAAATVIACKSSGRIHIDAELPGVHFSADGHWSYQDDQGRCFEIRFYDAQGNQVGSGAVTDGSGSGTVPANADRWEGEEVPCGDGFVSEYLAEVLVVGGPLGFERGDRSHNAVYELVVLCDPGSREARRIARDVIEAPLGAPIPDRVTVVFLAEAFEGFTSGRIVSLSQAPFVDFRVALNGDPRFADLATGTNAVQAQIGPGVWSVTTDVPFAALKGRNQWNVVEIEERRANQAAPTVVAEKAILYN